MFPHFFATTVHIGTTGINIYIYKYICGMLLSVAQTRCFKSLSFVSCQVRETSVHKFQSQTTNLFSYFEEVFVVNLFSNLSGHYMECYQILPRLVALNPYQVATNSQRYTKFFHSYYDETVFVRRKFL